ncbi:hypothetical protein ACMGE9_10630 [Macrococcus sp. EM39E]|uniref:hypothetical protein n=1 Tax=Macrococcus animalis TaxID=3395467 RepID=UPI0039BEB9FD
MLENPGPLFILIALCSLASAVILAFSFVFMHFYDYNAYVTNKKTFTKKRNTLLLSLVLGYLIFYALGMYFIN